MGDVSSTYQAGKPSVTMRPGNQIDSAGDRLAQIVVTILGTTTNRHCTRPAPAVTPSNTARYISTQRRELRKVCGSVVMPVSAMLDRDDDLGQNGRGKRR
jgi:hypothetical protein